MNDDLIMLAELAEQEEFMENIHSEIVEKLEKKAVDLSEKTGVNKDRFFKKLFNLMTSILLQRSLREDNGSYSSVAKRFIDEIYGEKND